MDVCRDMADLLTPRLHMICQPGAQGVVARKQTSMTYFLDRAQAQNVRLHQE